MNKVLVINAHPDFNSEESVSLKVLHHFKEEIKDMDPSVEIEQINLYKDAIPNVDQTVLTAWDKLG